MAKQFDPFIELMNQFEERFGRSATGEDFDNLLKLAERRDAMAERRQETQDRISDRESRFKEQQAAKEQRLSDMPGNSLGPQGGDRKHVSGASQIMAYIEGRKSGKIPSSMSFADWSRQMSDTGPKGPGESQALQKRMESREALKTSGQKRLPGENGDEPRILDLSGRTFLDPRTGLDDTNTSGAPREGGENHPRDFSRDPLGPDAFRSTQDESDLQEAAERDFQQAQELLNQANEDRRSRAEESEDLLRQNVEDVASRGEEMVFEADRQAKKIRQDFESFRDGVMAKLDTRNQQFQADVNAGIVTGMRSQMQNIENKLQSGQIGQAEAAAMKDMVKREAGSQSARIIGQAQNAHQQMMSRVGTQLSAQGAQVNQAASNLKTQARVQQQADAARAMLAASQGMFNTATLMSQPDRMLGELDAMMTLAQTESAFGDFDFGGFLGNDDGGFAGVGGPAFP